MIHKPYMSIVMAVYNVSPFLREAVDSVIAQDIGFDHVQLILVDDGSTDGSGAICDEYAAKYPDNILVLHKPNGGVSSARNLGLEHIQGSYVNFLDADDKLSKNALRKVYAFFQKHHHETDVVSIPMHFFDGIAGEHILNGKFHRGSRVIDLNQEWWTAQLSLSSAFVKAERLNGLRFDSHLANMEDAKLCQILLADKHTLGVVTATKYFYRKRSIGERSAVQKSTGKSAYYLPCMDYYQQDIVRFYLSNYHSLPRFVQYTLMYDQQWRWMQKTIPSSVLTAQEADLYRQAMHGMLEFMEEDVILAQNALPPVHKAVLLHKKTAELRHFPVVLDFMQWNRDSFLLEGRSALPVALVDKAQVEILINGVPHSCQMTPCHLRETMLDTPEAGYAGFRVECPYPTDWEELSVVFSVHVGEERIAPAQLAFGKHFPVGNFYRHAYCIQNGWLLTADASTLRLRRTKWHDRLCREPKYLAEIWNTNDLGGRKSIPLRLAYPVLKKLKRRPLWLISDRASKAGDNGEALFRYIREHHPEIDARFLVNLHSPDYQTLSAIGPVMGYRSLKHKFLSPLADFTISSQGDLKAYNPFDGYSEPYRDLFTNTKFVFLQHGITKDDISGWLNRYQNNFSGFVTAASPEYQSIISGNYYFSPNQIWLSGFPRFDRLYRAEQRQITIMPTWRRYLMNSINADTGVWSVFPGFEHSDYVRFYSSLLSNRRLLDAAERLGYTLAFFPHPNVQHHLHHFTIDPSVKMLGMESEYRDIYAMSNLVVTDYSSAVFDFAYLRKPVLYTQFDHGTFFSGAHTYEKGYFDYERDGFGEVEYDIEGTVDRIIEYMENGCQLKDQYRRRIDSFFAFDDQENCRRVFEKITELED